MKYWVFNEEQLDRAVREYVVRRAVGLAFQSEEFRAALKDFLSSQEAVEAKLLQGTSQ